jgi:hypothetical protein
MKTNSQNGRDPHQEFMEWVAAIAASLPAYPVDPKSTSDEREKATPVA